MPTDEGTRWQNYFLSDDTKPAEGGAAIVGSSARLNTVLSLASAPAPNRLEFTFGADTSMDVAVEIQQGEYDPLSSSPVNREWVELATVHADPGERVTVDIPVDMVEKIAYPTNFIKELSGERTNVYHTIHIDRLRELSEITGRAELAEWADRWEGYICEWSDMSLYDGMFALSPNSTYEAKDPAELC